MCAEGAVMLDVRDEYLNQFKRFGQVEVIQIPLSHLLERLNDLPRDRAIVVADSSGIRSGEAVIVLCENRFSTVLNLAGGFVEWEKDGTPILVDNRELLSGSCACQLRPRNQHNEVNLTKSLSGPTEP